MSRFGPTGISETSDDPRHFPSFPMHGSLLPILHHDCLTLKVEARIPYTLCFPQQLHFSSPKSSDRLLHAALHSKNRSDGVASLLLYPSGITPFTISNGFGLGFMAEYDHPGYCFLFWCAASPTFPSVLGTSLDPSTRGPASKECERPATAPFDVVYAFMTADGLGTRYEQGMGISHLCRALLHDIQYDTLHHGSSVRRAQRSHETHITNPFATTWFLRP